MLRGQSWRSENRPCAAFRVESDQTGDRAPNVARKEKNRWTSRSCAVIQPPHWSAGIRTSSVALVVVSELRPLTSLNCVARILDEHGRVSTLDGRDRETP